MMKCQFCDREFVQPFQCSYCHGYFCAEHRLPESHSCLALPKEPRFWYQKRKLAEEQAALVRRRIGVCPKCSSGAGDMVDYDAKTMTFVCRKCGHQWIRLKAFPHDIIARPIQQTTPISYNQQKESRKWRFRRWRWGFSLRKMIGLAIGALILLGWLLGPTIIYGTVTGILETVNAERLDTSLVGDEIFKLINEERKAYGHLNILEHSPLLAKVAKEWSDYLAKNSILDHGDFEGRMASTGISYGCGEIIAMVPLDSINFWRLVYPGVDEPFLARVFVDCWLRSPEHAAILTSAMFEQMGVGVSRNGATFYGVVDFSEKPS